MLITDFLLTRRSTRSFRKKELTDDQYQQLEAVLAQVNERTGQADFFLYTDGKRIYDKLDGQGGYGGVMIQAPSYIAMNIREAKAESYIQAAYLMEELVTEVRKLGLGSCWVTLSNVDQGLLRETFHYDEGMVRYLLAVGQPARSFNIFSTSYTPKIGVEDYVYQNLDKDPYMIEELEDLGLADLFYYLRMAPSSKDKQAWRFIIEDHEIKLYAENMTSLDDYIDIGIVLYYFYALAQASSLNTDWQIDIGEEEENGLLYIGKTDF